MQIDPTLDVDLTRALQESKQLADQVKPGSDRWDAIVVGSGAAGGMAAFQLAMAPPEQATLPVMPHAVAVLASMQDDVAGIRLPTPCSRGPPLRA